MNEIVFVCAIALAALFLRKKPLFPNRLKGRMWEKPPWHASLLRGAKRLRGAFSLVEMLMALLVASLLLAALAPVMTKKFNETIGISGVGSTIIPSGACIKAKPGSYLQGEDEKNDASCKIPAGVAKIGVIMASGGGGGGGAVKMTVGGVKYSDKITAVDGVASASFVVPKNAMNIKVQLLSGGGGGGVGATNGGGYPIDQLDCDEKSAGVYIGPEYSGANNRPVPNDTSSGLPTDSATLKDGYHSLCVSRYNPDLSSRGGSNTGAKPRIDGNAARYYEAGTSGGTGNCNDANCCWWGTTSTSGSCTGTNGNGTTGASGMGKTGQTYGGCDRAVCQWNAASTICSRWNPYGTGSGRLPSQNELSHWAPGINDVNSSTPGPLNRNNAYNTVGDKFGLQLCDYYSGHGSVWCAPAGSGCAGAAIGYAWANNCYVNNVWSDSFSDGINYFDFYMYSSAFYKEAAPYTGAFSVRCVQDRVLSFSSLNGGGGGSGLYAEVPIPNYVLRKAFKEAAEKGVDVKLSYVAGAGGEGGKINSSATYQDVLTTASDKINRFTSATNGGRSYAILYVGSVDVWKVTIPGGRAGAKANRSKRNGKYATVGSVGAGGKVVNIASSSGAGDDESEVCYYKNKYNEAYKNGEWAACNTIQDEGHTLTFNVGSAGANGGAGGAAYFPNESGLGGGSTGGSDAPSGGGGGSNGCSVGPTRQYAICGKAGKGGGGMARVAYQLARPGAGGAGGSAGAIVHMMDIGNVSGTSIDIVVGDGGNGGQPGIGGADNGKDGQQGGASSITWGKGTSRKTYTVQGGYGGGGGKAGRPDDTSTGTVSVSYLGNIPRGIDSIPGLANVNASGVAQSSVAFSDLKTITQRLTGSYAFFPGVNKTDELAKTKGKQMQAGGTCENCYTPDYYSAPGGNGGINSKISPKGQGVIPCGGLSKLAVDFYGMEGVTAADVACNVTTVAPAIMPTNREDDALTIREQQFNKEWAKLISEGQKGTYAGGESQLPGATGGGGGAWQWSDTPNATEEAGKGQKGMPGFVIIYWNLPEETEGGGT